MNRKKQAEEIAEAFALKFIENAFGHDFFIGSHIERLLADKATIIYQYVEDPHYFGAAVQHENNQTFIALNTFHSLRLRYFTAAHELWHLSEGSLYQNHDFDHERAADRFAAAIMLPGTLTVDLWKKFKKLYTEEEAIFYIADLAEVPYEAVARRLSELNEIVNCHTLSEDDWIAKRKLFNIQETHLDKNHPDTSFIAYEKVIQEAIEQHQLDVLTAANKLAKFAPVQAKVYQEKTQLHIREAHDDET